MKKLMCIFPVFLIFCSFVDSGGKGPSLRINDYEPELNIQYIGIDDTFDIVEKNRVRKADVVSNIAVYDIANNKTTYVFNDDVKRNIIGFEFESKYVAEYKTIEFNNAYKFSDDYQDELYQHSNNRNVSMRPLSENLIIITADLDYKTTTFWTATKYGTDVKNVMEIKDDWKWEIDVKNRMIRFSRQVNQKLEIRNVKY